MVPIWNRIFWRSSALVAVLCTIAGQAQALKGDWPMENFDAQGSRDNRYEAVLTKRSVKSLKLAWRLGGINPSLLYNYPIGQPVIAGGKLYVGTVDGHLYARDAATGGKLWTLNLGSWAASSPAVSNGIVYMAYQTAGAAPISAFDGTTGATLWTVTPSESAAGSPIVAHGRVFQGTESGTFYALDAHSGTTLWKSDPSVEGGGMGLPAMANGIVYSLGDTWLQAYDAATGEKLWYQNIETTGSGNSVTVEDGKIFWNGDDWTTAYDASTGALGWSEAFHIPHATFATARNNLYLLDVGRIWNINGATGANSSVVEEPRFYWSPTIANGVLYAGASNSVDAYDLKSGALLWSAPLKHPAQGSPVVANGMLYIPSGGSLYAYAPKD